MGKLPGMEAAIAALASTWRTERAERQARRQLDKSDFDALREAGLWRSVVPKDVGGAWVDMAHSARALCESFRRLAGADSSVTLVSAMHPSVVSFWLANPDPSQPQWEEQRAAIFASAAAGDQWGTVTSEPGSGGDIAQTRAVAKPTDAALSLPGRTYAVTGDKHFGSGLGVSDWMMTTAIPEGEAAAAVFVLDVRDWESNPRIQLLGEWDGMGMASTQSHAVRLDGVPAVRMARNDPIEQILAASGPFVLLLFTAVVVGIVDEAIATARAQLEPKADQLRAYERVEWARAEQDHWLATQAYEGALHTLESGDHSAAEHAARRAKQSVADLAEGTLRRLSRVLGGGTFSRRSPFAHWYEDVRALGFLRPPWGLAYDALFATSFGNHD
ncbi:MAG: hypothetical protein QOF21_1831 [Actinomycetota bacterium]